MIQSEKSSHSRKHEMLKAYNENRHTVWIPLTLLLLGGCIGLHRFYLGHIKIAVIIPIAILLVLIMMSGFQGISIPIWLPSAYGLFLVVEYYFLTKIIDVRNEDLRRKLSDEYGL